MCPLSSSLMLVAFLAFLGSLSPLLRAAATDDTACLQEFKQSLIDPTGYLANWKFGSASICSFVGVQCWEPTGNRVFSIKLPDGQLSGSFPSSLAKCSYLQGLDLSNNQFDGGIPSNISSILPLVTELDLSTNNFSGSIPEDLYNCMYINSLHLEHNYLTGNIPWQIGFLPRLTDLNLSYNNLSGQIPSSFTQRSYVGKAGFNSSAFEGNPNLCGAPLNSNCTGFR